MPSPPTASRTIVAIPSNSPLGSDSLPVTLGFLENGPVEIADLAMKNRDFP